MTHTLLAVTTPLLAAALLLTACNDDNDPTANTVRCSTFLKWDTTTQLHLAEYQIKANDVKDNAANESELAGLVIHACGEDKSANAQEIAASLAQDAATLGGN